MSGVIKNLDVRVVDGVDIRFRIVKHINQSFKSLDDYYEMYKKNPQNTEYELLWSQISDEIALLEGLGLLRKDTLDRLHEKLDSYI